VLPLHVNTSGLDFMIEDQDDGSPAIRFGLAAIKNVGESAVQILVEAREESGPSHDLQEFVHKVDLRQVGKKAIECLIRVGAFDGFASRSTLLESLDRIMNISASYFRAKEAGQLSLFGSDTGVTEKLELPPAELEISRRQQLNWERELLGVYVSDHPLSPYMEDINRIVTHFSAELSETNQGQEVRIAGEICQVRPYQTRNGKTMGFAALEDLQGRIDLVIFNRVWQRISEWLEPGIIVRVEGKIDRERGDPKVLVDNISQDISFSDSHLEEVPEPDESHWTPPDLAEIAAEPEIIEDLEFQQPHGLMVDWEPDSLQVEDRQESDLSQAVGENVETNLVEGDDVIETVEDIPDVLMEKQDEQQLSGERTLQEDSLKISPAIHGDLLDTPVSLPQEDVFTPQTILPPYPGVQVTSDGDLTMVKIFLRSTGDKKRDTLRMRRVYGLLTTYPGADRFAVYVFEGFRRYHLEFPNETTGYCPELQAQLQRLVGEANVQVEPLRLQ